MKAWECRCGERVPPASAHCGGCHRTFTGDRAFDEHRVGPYTDRQCMTVEARAEWRRTDRGWTNAKPMTDEQKARMR